MSLVTASFKRFRSTSFLFRKSLNEFCRRSSSIFFFTLVFLATSRLHSLWKLEKRSERVKKVREKRRGEKSDEEKRGKREQEKEGIYRRR